MKKILFFFTIFILVLTGAFLFINKYIYDQKQANTPNEINSYRGTLTGEYVCLPPKNPDAPHTLECAFGIKTDTGDYYALDFNLMSQVKPELNVGDRFTATGVITPIEMLSTDYWQKYNVVGIFSVADSVRIL